MNNRQKCVYKGLSQLNFDMISRLKTKFDAKFPFCLNGNLHNHEGYG